jgi:nucleotide-binding universal stress UspA family protein
LGVTQPIIAAVDPQREDVAPAALGALLARVLGAPLVLAAAYSVDLSIDNLHPEYACALGREADRAVERVAALVDDSGISLTTMAVPNGSSPARALHALAEREGAQLLVTGSSGRGVVGRLFPGAVTDRLLHGAPCPVAVAPAGFSPDSAARLGVVGVGFIDRPDGHAALSFAERLAEATHALVRILRSRSRPRRGSMASSSRSPSSTWAARARRRRGWRSNRG